MLDFIASVLCLLIGVAIGVIGWSLADKGCYLLASVCLFVVFMFSCFLSGMSEKAKKKTGD